MAGNNWTIQSSGTTQTLWAVSFTDSSNGTAVGEVGTILRTTDGGAHWITQPSGTVLNLRAVSFTDGNSGTAVGEGGVILRTTDGGNIGGLSQAARRKLCLESRSATPIQERL